MAALHKNNLSSNGPVGLKKIVNKSSSGIFVRFFSVPWQVKKGKLLRHHIWPLTEIPPVVNISISCTFAADDALEEVNYIDSNGEVTELEIQNGETGWNVTKLVTFSQSELGQRGKLMIQAKDVDTNAENHCTSAGVLVFCEANNELSLWHNFSSNIEYWKSEDNKELCTNNDANIINGHTYSLIYDLLDKGAEHLWVDGNQVVSLIGDPWSLTGKTISIELTKNFAVQWKFFITLM